MDGKYDDSYVTFIMTKTDSIPVQEVMNSLHLADTVLVKEVALESQLQNEIDEVEKQLTKAKSRVSESMNSLKSLQNNPKPDTALTRKRKQPDSEDTTTVDSELETDTPMTDSISQEREELERARLEALKAQPELRKTITQTKNLRSVKLSMKIACIQERNSYTQQHLRTEFQDGLLQLEEELRESIDGSDASKVSNKGGK